MNYSRDTSRKQGRGSIPWTEIILEAAFVVLGVVLAFAANEWRNDRADRIAGSTAAESISEELQLNRESVYRSLSYHIQVSDSLQAFDRRNPPQGSAPGFDTFPRGFISPAAGSLLSTAWNVAATTGAINHIPYDEVLLMSGLYDRQTAYREQSSIAGNLIYARVFEGGTDAVRKNYRNLNGIIQTFVYVECDLLRAYDEALSELSAEYDAAEHATVPRCQYFAQRG